MNKYPRESKEVVKFAPVIIEGVEQATFEYALTQGLERPDEWLDPINEGPDKAFKLTGLMEPGYWKVWVRVTEPDNDEIVIYADRFMLT